MKDDEIIRERIEFLKLEYQQLREHAAHLEEAEWKVRQLCVTLWLATLGVGLGLQGVNPNNFSILVASLFIPYIFLYMDARIGRWITAHRERRKQIELFLSQSDYVLPKTGERISFTDFASAVEQSYRFPVMDFGGKATLGNEDDFIFYTENTAPHMTIGLRRYFYQSQIIGSLIILSIQLYNMYQNPWIFTTIAIGPIIYWSIVLFSNMKFKKLLVKGKGHNKAKKQTGASEISDNKSNNNGLLSELLQREQVLASSRPQSTLDQTRGQGRPQI